MPREFENRGKSFWGEDSYVIRMVVLPLEVQCCFFYLPMQCSLLRDLGSLQTALQTSLCLQITKKKAKNCHFWFLSQNRKWPSFTFFSCLVVQGILQSAVGSPNTPGGRRCVGYVRTHTFALPQPLKEAESGFIWPPFENLHLK